MQHDTAPARGAEQILGRTHGGGGRIAETGFAAKRAGEDDALVRRRQMVEHSRGVPRVGEAGHDLSAGDSGRDRLRARQVGKRLFGAGINLRKAGGIVPDGDDAVAAADELGGDVAAGLRCRAKEGDDHPCPVVSRRSAPAGASATKVAATIQIIPCHQPCQMP